jgi:hypothetical protein
MKKVFKLNFILAMIMIMPLVVASGQEKKTEQKIKVIVDDGSGKKVIIDTVYKDTTAPDSIKLKDGSTVYIQHSGDMDESRHHNRRDKHLFVTYSADSNKDNGKEITVISSDSLIVKNDGDSNKVYFYTKSDELTNGKEGGNYTVITRSSRDRGDRGDRGDRIERADRRDRDNRVYIIKSDSDDRGSYSVSDGSSSDKERDSDMQKTRFVIAKDGMVVTVEGNDEAKAKELAKLIEQNLGVNNDDKTTKGTIKTETKKTIKK